MNTMKTLHALAMLWLLCLSPSAMAFDERSTPPRPQTLHLSPQEQSIIEELYTSTMRPLVLQRIEYDQKLLKEYRKCVDKALNVDAFRLCDKAFMDSRRARAQEISEKIENKRTALMHQRHVRSKRLEDYFK